MRIPAELRDHDAAGSLAEELPHWGWLEDGRTCLTRSGELITAGAHVSRGHSSRRYSASVRLRSPHCSTAVTPKA